MSEVDFTDPIFGEYVESQKQSISQTQNQNQKYGQDQYDEDYFKPNQQADSSICQNYRFSEKNASMPTSVKNRLSSHFVYPASITESDTSVDSINNYENNSVKLTPISEDDEFPCENCSQNPSTNCIVCGGNQIVKGNQNIVKFLEFILEFKIGNKEEYNPSKKGFKFKKNNVNTFCQDYFKSPNNQGRASMQPQKMCYSDLEQKLTSTNAVHHGFGCDNCSISPIMGSRYHCRTCGDYDECEECFKNSTHQHSLQKISKCGVQRQLEGVANLIVNKSNINLSSTLRPPPIINKSIPLSYKTYRSAIR